MNFKILILLFIFSNHWDCSYAISGFSISDTIPAPAKKRTLKPSTDFDQRFSFIRNASVNIWGQRAGILINDSYKVGVGGYYMNDILHSLRFIKDGKSTYYIDRRLMFGTVYYEKFIIRKEYWEFSIPIELGYGKSFSNTYANDGSGKIVHTTKRTFIPAGIGPSLSLKLPSLSFFKPLHWVGINFLAGYRYCLFENYLNTNYDGYFWSISGAVFLDKITDDYKTWRSNRKKASDNSK